MSETFIINQINFADPRAIEQLGSKPKFWFGDDKGQHWLFKEGRENTGEHWAEKVAYEVAELLEIQAAYIELAECEGRLGTISLDFTDQKLGSTLIHGNELIAGVAQDYDREKTFGQNQHTVGNIIRALSHYIPEATLPMNLEQCASYLVLDALIGNTDRHHHNWGVLETRRAGGVLRELAPSYDHASSLGREFDDEKRLRFLKEKRIEKYLLKGHGAIFWTETGKKGPSPLHLVERAYRGNQILFAPTLERLGRLEPAQLLDILNRVPEDHMSQPAREFALEFMTLSRQKLLAL